jgi:hypothetical protein
VTRRGTTMIELLIACTLFLLALALCGRLAVLGMRSRTRGIDRNSEFRRIITLFHLLQQDFQSMQSVYLPDLSDFGPHEPGSSASALVMRGYSTDGTLQVIGWQLHSGELSRTLYRLDFNPTVATTHVPLPEARPLRSAGVAAFRLQQQPPGPNFGARLLNIELECAPPVQLKLLTTIGMEL